MRRGAIGSVWLAGAAAMLMGGAALADHAGIQLISRGWTWAEADGGSTEARVSPDGNFIGLTCGADNLSPDDDNLATDIYLYSRTAETCVLVSATPAGQAGNGDSRQCSVSRDGKFVAFQSAATDLVDGDGNAAIDIFVKDMAAGVIRRVSVSGAGAEGNGDSINPSISADGRFVAFASDASNLVPGDTNGADDIFVHDRKTRKTWRISVDDNGIEGNGDSRNPRLSGDGQWVVFESAASNLVAGDGNGVRDVFIRPTASPGMARLSVSAAGVEGNGQSSMPSVSSDGRYVAFESLASNLVAGDTNGMSDIFRVDRELGAIVRASVNTAGVEANSESCNSVVDDTGRVFFGSWASNLEGGDANVMYDVFMRGPNPFVAGTDWTVMISRTPDNEEGDGGSVEPAISADGSVVAFESDADDLVPGDTNLAEDIFFRTIGDEDMGPMQRASVSSAFATNGDGAAGYPDISGNGRFAVFSSSATNLVPEDTNGLTDVFLVDRWLGTITRANVNALGQEATGGETLQSPRISPNGNYVAFSSDATNLGGIWPIAGAIVFVKNRLTGEVAQAISADFVPPDADCLAPVPTDAGGVAFYSSGTNIIPGDVNGKADVFYAEPATADMELVSVGPGGQADGDAESPAITPDARHVAFSSTASNLIDGGVAGGNWQIYVRDRTAGTTEIVSVSNADEDGNGNSFTPSISEDGRYVAFSSEASNLVAGDINLCEDIFVFDREERTIVRASVSSDGVEANGDCRVPRISADGRYVAFESCATSLVPDKSALTYDVFVHDLHSGRTIRVSMGGPLGTVEAGDHCLNPAISENGRHVVFMTEASLSSPVDDNGVSDAYCVLNHQPALAPGMTFPLSSGEVDGFGEATFAAKPKVALVYDEVVKFKEGARKSAKVRPSDYPADEVEGEWKSRIALLSPKAWPWNAMVCREAMDNYFVAGQAVIGDLRVTATRGGGTRVEDADAGEKVVVPPEITLVRNTSADSEEANVVESGDVLQVNGGFFGPKPKAWLEYTDAKGKLKQLKCKVAPGRQNAAGKPSCMGANGNGNMWVTIPGKWPKGWMHGRHDLVIDNGCGRACARLITSP